MRLKIPTKYLGKWLLIRAAFRTIAGIELNIPNITLEKNDSIIIHSYLGVETSLAVKTNENGSLRVLFSPPMTVENYVDVNDGWIKPDNTFRRLVTQKIVKKKKRKG